MQRTLIILLDSLILAGVLPGCGTAVMTIADMSGPDQADTGGFIKIVPSISEGGLDEYPLVFDDASPAEQPEKPAVAVAKAPAQVAAQPPIPASVVVASKSPPPVEEPSAPTVASEPKPPAIVPLWDKPILMKQPPASQIVEKIVAAPGSSTDTTVKELTAKFGIKKPNQTTVYAPAGESAGLVAFYAINKRELLVVDPLDTEGRVTPEAVALFEDLLRSNATDETHAIDPALVRLLYAVALAHDRVLMISSGYRPAKGSTKPTSYHTKGMAADIKHPYLPAKSIVDFARQWGAGGIGYYPKTKFVHLDVRDKPYYWVDYSGKGEKGQIFTDWEGLLADEAAAIWEPTID